MPLYRGGKVHEVWKFRLQIPSQDTAEGYFETGSIIIGTLAVLPSMIMTVRPKFLLK
jgi:hypothetical protein